MNTNYPYPKKCSMCKKIKSTSEFYKNKASKDGFLAHCKGCDYKPRQNPNFVAWASHPKPTGKDAPNWKGGKSKHKSGYQRLLVVGTCGYILEHRQVMEKYLGRKLLFSEDIHHLNGNKLDNRIKNLILLDRSRHAIIHDKLRIRDEMGRYL